MLILFQHNLTCDDRGQHAVRILLQLKQYADGMLATVVAGQVVLKENEHTGALPGQLLRGPLARQ